MDLGSMVHRPLPDVRQSFCRSAGRHPIFQIGSVSRHRLANVRSRVGRAFPENRARPPKRLLPAVCHVTDSRTFAPELAVRPPRTGVRPPKRLLIPSMQLPREVHTYLHGES